MNRGGHKTGRSPPPPPLSRKVLSCPENGPARTQTYPRFSLFYFFIFVSASGGMLVLASTFPITRLHRSCTSGVPSWLLFSIGRAHSSSCASAGIHGVNSRPLVRRGQRRHW